MTCNAPGNQLNIQTTAVRRFTLLSVAANTWGVVVCMVYFYFFVFYEDQSISWSFVTPASVAILLSVVGLALQRWWGMGLVTLMQNTRQGLPVSDNIRKRARREILNFPISSSLISLLTWGVGAITLSVIGFERHVADQSLSVALHQTFRIWFGIMLSGVMTSAIILFALEIQCRKIRPLFFPEGGLLDTPGAIRLDVRHRSLITFCLTGILPMMMMGILSYYRVKMMQNHPSELMLQNLFYLISFISIFGFLAILTLSHLFALSIIDPIRTIETGIRRVEAGDLNVSVPVYSCDEFGAMMENFNKMVEVLKERYRLKQALGMAMEVQQNLLPKSFPDWNGFDMAAVSTYCDETGGDYYDVIGSNSADPAHPVFVLGDVSDHGISSALLMASARAFIRMRMTMPGPLSRIISDVNRALCRDVENSGRFMTLFCGQIDRSRNHLIWINAGHDSAILYDPLTGRVDELRSENLPLGIFDDSTYVEHIREIHPGQFLVMGTDGIWDSKNEQGERFGKDRFQSLIRSQSWESAQKLVDAVMSALQQFCRSTRSEDDITLLVVRLTE